MNADEICRELEGLRERGAKLDVLFATAVKRIYAADRRYDWTGIYELYPDRVLRLSSFAGPPTDHAFVAPGNGLCDAALEHGRTLVLQDVAEAPGYVSSSPRTRSMLVVLLRRGEEIYGEIEVDSHEPGAFPAEDVEQVERVAEWLADAFHHRSVDAPPR